MIGSRFRGRQLFFKAGCRNYFPNKTLRRIFQDTGGQAGRRISDDDTAVRIFSVPGYAGEFKREAIRERHVAVEAIYEHRCVWGELIN